jgi:GTPase Era involved in 16S rRNA processing
MNKLFEEVKSICYSNNFSSLFRQIESIENKMKVNNFIDIAVLGQFKSGKSSFLNSLVSENILPMGVVPVTSVITRIYGGNEKIAKIKFNNNHIQQTSINEIANYVTENKNPKNEKNVFVVDIETPTLLEFSKLRFIDTPGIGSVFKHNTETTENWFSEIGLAFVTISAERPLGENEINLIKDISAQCPEIIILLTKVDLFSNEQLNEIQTYIQNILRNEFDKEFRLFRYSTVKNTDNYRNEIVNEIILPIVSKFDITFNEILNHKNNQLAKSCLSYLEIAYKTAQNNETEKQNLKEQIFEEQLNKAYLSQELRLIATSYKSQNRDKIYAILQKHQNKLTNDLKTKFIQDYQSWHENLYKIARKYELWIKENLTNQFVEVLNLEYQQFVEISNTNKKHFQAFIKSFRDRLNANIEKVLNVKMLDEDFEIAIKLLKKPNISISWSFEIHIDLLWFLIPMSIFKNVFRRHFLNLIGYEVEKNIHRITSDLNEEMNKLITEYENQSLKYITNELTTIENILLQSKFESQYYQQKISDLLNLINQYAKTYINESLNSFA